MRYPAKPDDSIRRFAAIRNFSLHTPAFTLRKGGETMEETKSARFLRVAEPRVNRACKAISLIGNLARGDYEYTDEQANAMIAAIQNELDGVKMAFKRKQEKKFKF